MDKASSAERRGAGTCFAETAVGESLRTRSWEAWAAAANEATRRPQRSFGLMDVAVREAARMLLRMLLRPDGFRGCMLRTRLWEEDERCRRCIRGQWTTWEGRRFPWTHVAAERHLGMLFANEAARGGGGNWGRAATRRRGHGTATEIVASVDVVPTAVGDVAHVTICSLLVCLSRALHIATTLCVCSLSVLDSAKMVFGTPPDGREIFLTSKRGSSARQTRKT